MIGIENIKKLLKFSVDMQQTIHQAGQDGFFNVGEKISIAFKALGIVPIATKYKEIGQELIDLTDTEKKELKVFCSTEFKLQDDRAQAVVEMSIGLLIELIDYSVKMAELFKK